LLNFWYVAARKVWQPCFGLVLISFKGCRQHACFYWLVKLPITCQSVFQQKSTSLPPISGKMSLRSFASKRGKKENAICQRALIPGPNPAIASHKASGVKNYNAIGSLERSENTKYFLLI
jgi:hypothetical protein